MVQALPKKVDFSHKCRLMESAPCDTQPRHHQPWEVGRCSFPDLGNLLTSQTRSWQKGELKNRYFECFGVYLKCRSGSPSAALLVEETPIPIDFFFLGGMFCQFVSNSPSLRYPKYLKVKYKLNYLQWSWHWYRQNNIAILLALLDFSSPEFIW